MEKIIITKKIYFKIFGLSFLFLHFNSNADTFNIKDLGTISGVSRALDISSNGNFVVGYSGDEYGNLRAFRWSNAGKIKDLGTLKSDNTGSSEARGIAYDGETVVGMSYLDDNN